MHNSVSIIQDIKNCIRAHLIKLCRPSTKTSFSILFFALSLMGSLIFAVYSGCLISILASDEPHVPFTTTGELANLPDFKLLTYGSGSTYKWLKSMTNITKGFDYVLTHYVDPYSLKQSSPSQSEYVEWLIANKGPNVGLIMEDGWLDGIDYAEFDKCDIMTVPMKEHKPLTNGWMYPKNSLLQPLFDQYMLELYQTGIVKKIEKKHTIETFCTEGNGYIMISFGFVKILFIVLSVGVSISVIIALFEKLSRSLRELIH